MQIRLLNRKDISLVISAIDALNWSVTSTEYQKYILEQLDHKNPFLIMLDGNKFVGHVLLKWHSDYPYFLANKIPEIANLAIMPEYLRQGHASRLMTTIEQIAKTQSHVVGLGVGLYHDYGPAQRLYMKRGYQLDGHGMTYKFQGVIAGTNVMVDDDLLIWMIKNLEVHNVSSQ